MDANQRAKAAWSAEQASARTCIVTRVARPPEALIRFVVGPDASIVPDVARKLPGRGVWVTCCRDVVGDAVKKGAFARSLRSKVNVDPELAILVDRLLVRRALDQLSISNKAGLLQCGLGKVDAWLSAGADGALIQAVDASPNGLAKVARKYRAVCAASKTPPIEVSMLTINELSLAIGRANVVHAALSKGNAATNFLAAVSRVERYRATEFEAPAFVVADEAVIEQSQAIRNTGQV
ncbi:MAG: RNA-binding protein [Hyphomicrobiaceae bacterium]